MKQAPAKVFHLLLLIFCFPMAAQGARIASFALFVPLEEDIVEEKSPAREDDTDTYYYYEKSLSSHHIYTEEERKYFQLRYLDDPCAHQYYEMLANNQSEIRACYDKWVGKDEIGDLIDRLRSYLREVRINGVDIYMGAYKCYLKEKLLQEQLQACRGVMFPSNAFVQPRYIKKNSLKLQDLQACPEEDLIFLSWDSLSKELQASISKKGRWLKRFLLLKSDHICYGIKWQRRRRNIAIVFLICTGAVVIYTNIADKSYSNSPKGLVTVGELYLGNVISFCIAYDTLGYALGKLFFNHRFVKRVLRFRNFELGDPFYEVKEPPVHPVIETEEPTCQKLCCKKRVGPGVYTCLGGLCGSPWSYGRSRFFFSTFYKPFVYCFHLLENNCPVEDIDDFLALTNKHEVEFDL
ncbi:MAG: hypothetical protein AAF335_01295 [Bacteroidota bacterium]